MTVWSHEQCVVCVEYRSSYIFTGSVGLLGYKTRFLHFTTEQIRCPTYPHGAIVNSVPRLQTVCPHTEQYAAKSNKRSYRHKSNSQSVSRSQTQFICVVTGIVRTTITIKDTIIRLLRFPLAAGVSVLPPPEQVQRGRQHRPGQQGGDQPGPIRGEHWGHVTRLRQSQLTCGGCGTTSRRCGQSSPGSAGCRPPATRAGEPRSGEIILRTQHTASVSLCPSPWRWG